MSVSHEPELARPCRVLMVTGAYHPEISSGGTQCQSMARLLAGRADVQVLTTSVDGRLARHDTVDGIPVTRIAVDVRSPLSRVLAARRMLVELLRLVSRSDIVHLHGISTKNILVTLVARMLGCPLVLSLHTAGFDEPAAVVRHSRLAWWAFTAADRYLSVSPSLVDAYLAAGLPRDRIQLVPNGIDTVRFAPVDAAARSALRQRLGLPAGPPLVLFVGFFSHDKQPRVLFDAWLHMCRTGRVAPTLAFVGATTSAYFEVDSTIAETMRGDAEAHGLADRLVFAGVSHDVPDYLCAADVFALPSRREGLPLALLEAMACGLPCVASRLEGSTDGIIRHQQNGVLVEVGDVEGLAGAITSLLEDPVRAASLGGEARATVTRRFASTDIADRWIDVYSDVSREARH